MPGTVRARWKGGYAGYVQGDVPIADGDLYLIYPAEAYGSTTYTDPVTHQVQLIGPGHVVKPEHAGIPKPQLQEMGYRFDEPSRNWEVLDPYVPQTYAQIDLPQEVDLSAYLVPDTPAEPAPAADPELQAVKDEAGRIEIVTTLPPPPEPEPPAQIEAAPPEQAEPSAEEES